MPPDTRRARLTEGSPGRHLMRLTVPMLIGILAIMSFQLADTYFVARLGTPELAAITFTFPLTFGIFHTMMGLSVGMSSVVSRLIGAGEQADVVRVTTHGILFAALCGLLISAAGIASIDPLFTWMGADAQTLPLIRDYMMYWYGGCLFITVPLVGNAAIRATGDAMFPAMIMVAAALINIVLDPIMIFGLFGFPRLEMAGAAIATVLSNGLAMLAGLYFLHVKKKLIFQGRLELRRFFDSIARILHIGVPAAMTQVITPLTNGVLVALLASYGADTVAAFGVATRIEAFAFLLIIAIAVAMSPILGQNWGAGLMPRVRETLRIAFTFCVVWSLAVAGILMAFASDIALPFSDHPGVIEKVGLYFLIVPLSYAFGNLINGWSSAFNAIGMPRQSFIMIAVRMLALNIPLAYAGNAFFGVAGIFASIAVTNVVAGGVFHFVNRRLLARRMAAQG